MNIVRELRKKKGIQQKELALEIGVSIPTVSDWETGKKDPSGDRLRKLAEYFGVDELVILGKEVISIGTRDTAGPKTEEARIISGGVDRLPKAQREQALRVFRAMFDQHPELFDDTEEKQDDFA